ncbi:hypothetical protein M378DRAFT_9830 [Amanita muscaria Koide BX008]|uniref:Uncharacterized protein n=1 Tax=Amanita muscaria (strain Koide BX008) TaxID=946122 RepID=A0A0C2STQ6_AMAMK|nr:hypothetical protein M378DRAFT_9830 [Amanita muscaria Koide BX008]
MTEFWLSYHFSSRSNLQPTIQPIELDHLDYKLSDLEDVLDYAGILVFQKGFVDAKYRPATWWEKKDGAKIKSTTSIASLLEVDAGNALTALSICSLVEDLPSTLWFSYIYLHKTHSEVVTQRVKFANLSKRFERLANVTNYVFAQGYLPCKYRGIVHWDALVASTSTSVLLLTRSWPLAKVSAKTNLCALSSTTRLSMTLVPPPSRNTAATAK